MAITTTHPLYSYYDASWILCRDCYEGEDKVKSKGTLYLPATSGQLADGINNATDTGYIAYQSYKTRAVFHNFLKDAVETYLGVMWQKPPVIQLPKIMEPMQDKATIRGESLVQLLRRVNEQQLITGRVGLLLDLPTTPTQSGVLPYIASYNAESIINWDDGKRDELQKDSLNLVVLNESEYIRKANFVWETEQKYRVLVIGDITENEPKGTYKVGVFAGTDADFNEAAMLTPSIKGRTLESIPFVFINSKDIISDPDTPPMLSVAKLALAIYRGEADYRQSLFMQGQDTLVVVGATGDEKFRVGSGSAIVLQNGGDAKFIGVSSTGLAEQRQALENDKVQISAKAGQLIDTRSREQASAEALNIRVSAQTATLQQIALSGAGGLQKVLRHAAEWLGANPEEVIVTPNTDFTSQQLPAEDLVKYMTAKSLGAPLSKQTIHNLMKAKGLTELEYEEELAEIEAEEPELTGTDAGGDPDATQ